MLLLRPLPRAEPGLLGSLRASRPPAGPERSSESPPAAGLHRGKQPHLQQSPRFPPCSCHNLLETNARSKLSSVTSSAALLSGCWTGEESSPTTRSLSLCTGRALPALSKRPFSAPQGFSSVSQEEGAPIIIWAQEKMRGGKEQLGRRRNEKKAQSH